MADDVVALITESERILADPTPGMIREQAIAAENMWAGVVRTEAHHASGWHHHGEHDSTIYVVEGEVRLEFGLHGRRVVDASPGAFVRVPKQVIHRESNPGDHESRIVVLRVGAGPLTVNVGGPQGNEAP